MKEHEPFSGRFLGIFNVESDDPSPIAMFSSREDADVYLAEKQALHFDCDDHLSESCQVFRVDALGVWWNSYDPDPRAGSPLSPDEIAREYGE